jgi:hypothetical protein
MISHSTWAAISSIGVVGVGVTTKAVHLQVGKESI